jgi:hypothetical protein
VVVLAIRMTSRTAEDDKKSASGAHTQNISGPSKTHASEILESSSAHYYNIDRLGPSG